MRWAITSAVVLMLFGVGFADEAQETGRTLTPEQAQEAIQDADDYLSLELEHVTSLTPEAAAILAKHKGELALYGLEVLSADAAKALAKHDGRLSLNSISSLPEDAALALAKHQGDLCMQGLAELHCEPLARQLLLAGDNYRVGGDGGLNPDRLTSISPEVAELLVIATQDGAGLSLPELKSPPLEVLRVLARCSGDLSLGVVTITPEMAQVLATQRGTLDLPFVHEIDKETLSTLSQKEGGLELHLPAITSEIAAVLRQFHGNLIFHVERLAEDVERVLAEIEAIVEIPELKQLKTGDLARKLVEQKVAGRTVKGQYSDIVGYGLDANKQHWNLALEDLSSDAAEQLKDFRGILKLRNCEKLSAEVADKLAECEGDVMLPALRELSSTQLATKLAKCREDLGMYLNALGGWGDLTGLYLPRLRSISPDVARALASQAGHGLILDGLSELPDEAADALASCEGILSLKGVTALTPHAQKALGQGNAKYIRLSGLLELTDPLLATKIVGVKQLEKINAAVAAVLAGRPNSRGQLNGFYPLGDVLSLNLKEITPGVAAALATKDGRKEFIDSIELPALQTIDVVSASELAQCRVNLYLTGLKELSPEAAKVLCRRGIVLPKQLRP